MKVFIKKILSILEIFGLKVVNARVYDLLLLESAKDPVSYAELINLKLESVIHIGGHYGQERHNYLRNGLSATFIEGDPEVFAVLVAQLQGTNFDAVNVMLSNKAEERKFYKSSHAGVASSLLEPLRHLEQYPEVKFHNVSMVSTVTLDSLNMNGDLIVMDVQGAEHLIIEGGKKTIKGAKALYLECNVGDLYKGDCSLEQLIKLLEADFSLVRVSMNKHFWGDAFFVNREIIRVSNPDNSI
jgi:FkbM family methyltransferase